MTLLTCLPGLHAICDDYFYYERIARNILSGHGSTFDGVVPTNGYQPLWMLFVLLAVAIEHVTAAPADIVVIGISALLAAGSVWVLGRALMRVSLFEAACLLVFCAYAVYLAVLGMEVSLLLLFGSCYFLRLRRSDSIGDWVSGLCLALCFLCRVDSPVYFLPSVLYVLAKSPGPARVRFLTPVAVTVAVYCAANQLFFGLPVPVSGVAKSVERMTSMHPATWGALVLGLQSQLMLLGSVLVTAWVLVNGSREQKILALLSAIGVLAFFVTTSIRSDWFLWPWYEYPLALHVGQLALLGAVPRASRVSTGLAAISVAVGVACIVLLVPRNVREARREGEIHLAAAKLQALFADQPNLVLAMGDRAGSVGGQLSNRLIQLEGLVMDKTYLQRMRSSDSIIPVLQSYGVDYYIATNPTLDQQGCYITLEPAQSHGYSHRIATRICNAATADFRIGGWHTVVFRIGAQSAKVANQAQRGPVVSR